MPTNQTANTVVAAPLVNPLNDDDLQALNHVINQAAIHADLIALQRMRHEHGGA